MSVFIDKNKDGEFRLNEAADPAEQVELDAAQVFDGVLTLGRRSQNAFELQ